uniref:Uncharacterized protein n=1 Tax=Haptolina ericina TaxID=156174 RepID=A0A7S3AHL5_9EUKA
MLQGMRLRNETFTLVYTRVKGPPPSDHAAAEAWRAAGCGKRIELTERAGGSRACSEIDTCKQRVPRGTEPCRADELAVLEAPPGWLARTILLSNPYPILQPAGRYCGSSG